MSFTRRLVLTIDILALILTVIALLVNPGCPVFPSLITNNLPPYCKLNNAMRILSKFSQQHFQTQRGVEIKEASLLQKGEYGFDEMLSLIKSKYALPVNERCITHIIIVKIGAPLKIGKFDITPQYMLGIVANNTVIGITPLWEGEIQSWIQTEKQNGLQRISLYLLIFAVLLQLSSKIFNFYRISHDLKENRCHEAKQPNAMWNVNRLLELNYL